MAEEQTETKNETEETTAPASGIDQLRSTYSAMTPERRRILLGVAVVVFLGFGAIIFDRANATEWQPLVRGLLPEDQAVVVEAEELVIKDLLH